MSSRALRRLQREKENQRGKLEHGSSDDEELVQSNSQPSNAFQMLNLAEDEGTDEGGQDQEEAMEDEVPQREDEDVENDDVAVPTNSTQSSAKRKPKKKKKKRKVDIPPSGSVAKPRSDSDWDEIDRAKRDLLAEGKWTEPGSVLIDKESEELYRLLAVDTKHLNALNEMRRLFGNVVLENNDDESAGSRRRGRGPQNLDLGTALTARHSPVSRGQGLKGPLLKRNPFIMGKEEWPQATGGGLGMELVENLSDGTTEYRFVHNNIYQGVQREFEACVASMDPQRLITMLMYNPYHVSTLLQVSEIAKQQGDHSVASDLLERALFTFGRAAVSSFASALGSGTARLDFRRPENREFWLAGFRYVKDLGQRGTWRTAYEWAKLILSLDPEGDPYCMHRIIDQLALRSGQYDHFIQLADTGFYRDPWSLFPNIHISKSLCQYRLKQTGACRDTMTDAVHRCAVALARLFKELNLDNLPKLIWGKRPRSHRENFEAECYALNAKDIWALPDSISFLVESVETAKPQGGEQTPADERPLSLDDVRSTLLTSSAPLINLLPRELTSRPTTSSNPLPPDDDLLSYDPSLPNMTLEEDAELEAAYADLSDEDSEADSDRVADTAANEHTPNVISSYLSRIIPWRRMSEQNGGSNEASPPSVPTPRLRLYEEQLRNLATQNLQRPSVQEAPAEADGDLHDLANSLDHDDAESSHDLNDRMDRVQEFNERVAELPDERPLGADTFEDLIELATQLIADFDSAPQAQRNRAIAYLSGILRAETEHYLETHDDDNDLAGQNDQSEQNDQPSTATTSTSTPNADTSTNDTDTDSQAHLQNYLAGAGIQSLKAYLDSSSSSSSSSSSPHHGASSPKGNPTSSIWSTPEGSRLLTSYATKLSQLQNRRMRDFILRFSLPQGTSREVGELVEARMGR